LYLESWAKVWFDSTARSLYSKPQAFASIHRSQAASQNKRNAHRAQHNLLTYGYRGPKWGTVDAENRKWREFSLTSGAR